MALFISYRGSDLYFSLVSELPFREHISGRFSNLFVTKATIPSYGILNIFSARWHEFPLFLIRAKWGRLKFRYVALLQSIVRTYRDRLAQQTSGFNEKFLVIYITNKE